MIVRGGDEGRYDATRASAERGLWRAVISQAIADATQPGTSQRAVRERDSARAWVNSVSADFRRVCDLADLEPDRVRLLLRQKMEECDGRQKSPDETIEINGERKTPAEWAAHIGISKAAFMYRVSKGLPPEKLLLKSARPVQMLTHDGFTGTLAEWSVRSGIPLGTIVHRITRGVPLAEALSVRNLRRPDADAKTLTLDGVTLSVRRWSKRTGLPIATIFRRMRFGWPAERILAEPERRSRDHDQSELTCDAPGVVGDFRPTEGTGGGSIANDLHEMGNSDR